MSSDKEKLLEDINRLNENVYDNILSKRDINKMNVEDLSTIRDRLRKPKNIISEKMHIEDSTEQKGCKKEFLEHYNTLLLEDSDEVTGKITILGKTASKSVQYDIELVRTMKSLLLVGVTPNEELAEACRIIVNKLTVLGTASEYVTISTAIIRLTEEKKLEGITGDITNAVLEVLKKCMHR